MGKSRFYVVWNGITPGIYDSWAECKMQVDRQEGARYKAFDSREDAIEAFRQGYQKYLKKSSSPKAVARLTTGRSAVGNPETESLSVDAACSGNPGKLEYRGVHTGSKKELFRIGPLEQGTNNVGEFLALVHGLALLKKNNSTLPIYSDSVNAIKWVQKKKAKTMLEQTSANQAVFTLIQRAEKWLQTNDYSTRILKWETAEWGEIPADFGRK